MEPTCHPDDAPLQLPISRRPPNPTKQHKNEPQNQQPSQALSNTLFQPRDPRFDPRCSSSKDDARHFERNYAFIDEIRMNELNMLQKALTKEKDSEKRKKIKLTIARIRNKMVEKDNKTKRQQLICDLKASKKSQFGPAAAKTKFVNVRKSDIKKTLMVEKFKELKESGKLSKYMERKRKKLINRDGKAFN